MSRLLHQINPQASPLSPLTIKGLKNDLEELVFSCEFKVEDLFGNLTSSPSRRVLQLTAPDLPLPYQTLLKNRQQPLAINNNIIITDRTTLQLHTNNQDLEFPASGNENLPRLKWQIESKLDKNKKSLIYERKLKFQRGVVSAKGPDYDNFTGSIRDFYQPEALRIIFSATKPNPQLPH